MRVMRHDRDRCSIRPKPITGALRPLLPKPLSDRDDNEPICHFLRLPRELRCNIYNRLFDGMTVSRRFPAAGFLRVNRQINKEMTDRLHERFSFMVVNDYSGGKFLYLENADNMLAVDQYLSEELDGTSWTRMFCVKDFWNTHPVRMSINIFGGPASVQSRCSSFVAIADLHLHDIYRAIGGMTYAIDVDEAAHVANCLQDAGDLGYQVHIERPENPHRKSVIPAHSLLAPIRMYWQGHNTLLISWHPSQPIFGLAVQTVHAIFGNWFEMPFDFFTRLETLRRDTLRAVVRASYIIAAEHMRDFEHFFQLYKMTEDEWYDLARHAVEANEVTKYRWEFIIPFAKAIYLHAAAQEGPDAEVWRKRVTESYDGYEFSHEADMDVVYDLAPFGMPNGNKKHCETINALLQGRPHEAFDMLTQAYEFLTTKEQFDFENSEYQEALLIELRGIYTLSFWTCRAATEREHKAWREETVDWGRSLLRKWFGDAWREYARTLLDPDIWEALE
jgi:hypothetical protein